MNSLKFNKKLNYGLVRDKHSFEEPKIKKNIIIILDGVKFHFTYNIWVFKWLLSTLSFIYESKMICQFSIKYSSIEWKHLQKLLCYSCLLSNVVEAELFGCLDEFTLLQFAFSSSFALQLFWCLLLPSIRGKLGPYFTTFA